MSENPEKLREKYTDILISNGIKDKVAEVIVSDSGAKGDGMASLTQCVTVKFENQEKPPLNLFVKVHTDNPSHEMMLANLKAFEKEARFFMEYLPAAKQMCKSKGQFFNKLDEFIDFYPKCYYGDDSLIVLENLVIDRGYQMLPHEERHDFNTASFALQTLAKHHALSYAMIQESGGEDKFFQQFPNLDHDGFISTMLVEMIVAAFEQSLKTNMAIFQKNKVVDGRETLVKLSSLEGKTRDMLLCAFHCNKDEELLVLNHGDYKSNNLMFLKNKETNEIVHHIAIDLQVTRYNSPALDISAYLFTSVDPTARQTRLQELLNIYLDTLKKTARDLGHPMELSYEDLLMQYRKKSAFGFLAATTIIGPGMGLLKIAGIDIGEIDVADFPKVFIQCLLKWVDEHPEKGRAMAEEIKNLVDEYIELEL